MELFQCKPQHGTDRCIPFDPLLYKFLAADQIAALKVFHDRGIFTWVLLESTLDCEGSLTVVEATHELVDLHKVGQANYLPMKKPRTGRFTKCG
jgi:hypothetical protein